MPTSPCASSFLETRSKVISTFDPLSGQHRDNLDEYVIYPANLLHYHQGPDQHGCLADPGRHGAAGQTPKLRDTGRPEEAKRIEQSYQYDLEMIKELGYCSGIENYSRYFDGRAPGTRPFCHT